MEPKRIMPFPNHDLYRYMIICVDIDLTSLKPLKKILEGLQKMEIKGPYLGP